MANIAASMVELTGNTPLVRLNGLAEGLEAGHELGVEGLCADYYSRCSCVEVLFCNLFGADAAADLDWDWGGLD